MRKTIHVGLVCWLSMKLGGRKLNWDPEREQVRGDDEANDMINVPMREPWVV